MASMIQCDRCGKTKEARATNLGSLPDEWGVIELRESGEMGYHVMRDLCSSCFSAAQKFLTTKGGPA